MLVPQPLNWRLTGPSSRISKPWSGARMFFNSSDLGLGTAALGTFSLNPINGMAEELRRDYGRMTGMIIGDAPRFEDVMASIASLEAELNQ